jgi:iron complex outermembrane receptor protein
VAIFLSKCHLKQTRFFAVLTAAVLALSATGTFAETEQSENILVTATRLSPDNSKARGNTTIITAADIQKSTARTLPELLGREAGVLTRSLFGNNATAASVDIRGFGATGTQNTLILIDGRRLNDVDLSSVDFSVIPLQSIERIEITRNSGAVLYGDGAVGGAINIITRQPEMAGTSAFVKAGAGNLDTQQLDAQISHNAGPLSVLFGAHGISSDGYRDNNKLDRKNLNSDIRFTHNNSQFFLRADWFDQDLDLPGVRNVNPGIGINQLRRNRKGTNTPRDYADQDGYSINPGITHYWDNGSEAVIDFGYRKKNQKSFFDDYDFGGLYSSYLDTDLDTWSFTPRVITPHHLFGRPAQTTAGLDYYDSDYDSDRSLRKSTDNQPIHRLHIDQQSTAIYADTTIAATPDITVNLGARLQWVKLDAKDKFDPDAPGAGDAFESGAPDYDDSERVHMLEAGIEKQFTPATAAYLKWTRSARVTTVDELFEFDPNTFTRVFSPLDPQISNGFDIGTRFQADRTAFTINAYYMKLKDEIHFNPVTFVNVNLDPTRRYGLELSGSYDISDRLRLQGNYTFMRAKFRDGDFSGKNVPLVPENTASLTGIWKQSPATDFIVAANYVDNRYFDNDQSNTFEEKIPSYTTIDTKVSHRYRGFRLTAEINNIFEEKIYDYGVSSTFSPGVYNAYPLPERTILFTVSKDFGNWQ